MILGDNIRKARTAAGLTQQELGARVHVSRAAIAQWESGTTMPTRKNLLETARVLNITLRELFSGTEYSFDDHETVTELTPPVPSVTSMPRDLEVLGTAAGGNDGDFSFNGIVVDYVRRPPALAGIHNAFAIYLHGDSMEPRYDNGELLIVHPGRPVTAGADVLVELHAPNGDVGHCMVKQLLRKTGTKYIFRQFNPPRDDIEIPISQVKHIYRVMRFVDLLGA